jgi:hypothetical protein
VAIIMSRRIIQLRDGYEDGDADELIIRRRPPARAIYDTRKTPPDRYLTIKEEKRPRINYTYVGANRSENRAKMILVEDDEDDYYVDDVRLGNKNEIVISPRSRNAKSRLLYIDDAGPHHDYESANEIVIDSRPPQLIIEQQAAPRSRRIIREYETTPKPVRLVSLPPKPRSHIAEVVRRNQTYQEKPVRTTHVETVHIRNKPLIHGSSVIYR